MSIRQRTTGPRKQNSKLASVAGDHSKLSKTQRTLWIRTGFIATCAAALLVSLYWTGVLPRIPHQLILPVPYSNDSNGPAFIVRELPGRGKGMIAVRNIRRGELLIREHPLVLVPHEIKTSPSQLILDLVRQLSADKAASFYNLSHVDLPGNLSHEEFSKLLPLAIFQTNAVAAGSNVGLFPTMARLNHGCSGAFNSVYSWREREGVLVVHALKDIHKGEELLTAYFRTLQTRDERRHHLKQNYDFRCTCACCALPDEESKASDIRLTMMSDLYNRLSTWGHGTLDGSEAIRLVKRIWAIGEEEGYNSERGRLAADAVLVAVAHSEYVPRISGVMKRAVENATKHMYSAEAAVEWSKLGLQWASYELGSDSDLAEEMRIAIREPKRHTMWGQRSVMAVGQPLERMSGV